MAKNIEIKVGGETTTFQAVKRIKAHIPDSENTAVFVEESEIANNLEYKTITSNGIYTASSGYYGIGSANVDVSVGDVGPISITPTGDEIVERAEDNNLDGFSEVTITGDSNLNASNIKLGVEIYGVTGTLVTTTTNNGLPIEIDSEGELAEEGTNVANVGKIYKYTGEAVEVGPPLFESNGIYLCVEDEVI